MSKETIVIGEEFSVEDADKFRTEAKSLIQKGTYNFVIDFNKCKFIDSTGLGVIVSVYKRCLEHDGSIQLQNLNNDVLKIFKLTRLDKVFDIR